jgi:hypothetical protein
MLATSFKKIKLYDVQYSQFSTWSLYFYLVESMLLVCILSIIALTLRLILFRKEKFKNNLFYVFCGYLSMIISIIWSITLLMKIITFDHSLTEYGIANFFLTIIILADLYFPRKHIKIIK